jgi:trehalose 6-phosphate phosphatase
MKPGILRNLQTLNDFALSNVLVALDYDGTLAPIAPTPRAARMRESTRRLLGRVAERYPCVVISGRALDDVTRRLEGIPIWYVFGNHGLESPEGSGSVPAARGWLDALREKLTPTDGLIVEDKGHSITIHYRNVPDKAGIVAAINEAVASLDGARALAGIEAISVLPRDGRHKGLALQEARRQFACDTAIYIGDDETDEDAFASGEPAQLLSIRIGRPPTTTARYSLERQDDIDALLRALLVARDARRPRVRQPAR